MHGSLLSQNLQLAALLHREGALLATSLSEALQGVPSSGSPSLISSDDSRSSSSEVASSRSMTSIATG